MRAVITGILAVILAISISSCGHGSATQKAREDYPSHWWSKVNKKDAKWWEVLPAEAGEGEVILSKRNELGLLSNFAHTPFTFEGAQYQSVEGLWQSMKFPENKDDPRYKSPAHAWGHSREQVQVMVGFKAKKAGDIGSKNMQGKGINWVTYKGDRMTYRTPQKGKHYQLIRKIMLAKVEQNQKVRDVLLATDGLILRADHQQKKNSPPAWLYNKIWMEIRSDLKKGL
ncbi:MAG: NADAR family protein [Halobacteriovoraceae bacterium]|nr:NADAR family protein [Halobacteriovoraceae bacterium]MBT5093384.1 NADAR family protein [Halobacteriovoraceae bacterium]